MIRILGLLAVLSLSLTTPILAQPPTHNGSDPATEAGRKVGDLFKKIRLQAESADQCKASWKGWQDKYASTSPLGSINKTSQWKYSKSQIQSVIDGNSVVKFPETLSAGGSSYSQIDVSQLSAGKSVTDRGGKIRSNIEQLVKNNPPNNLLIVWTGLSHTLDYFHSNKDSKVIYASYPVDANTEFESDGMYEFMEKATGQRQARPTAKDDWAGVYPAPLAKLHYYNRNTSSRVSADELMGADTSGGTAVILSDYHAIRNTSPTDDLPSADCLKQLGFTSVTIAAEGVERQGTTGRADLEKKIDFAQALGTDRINRIRQASPEAITILESGRVIPYPELKGIMDKVKKLEQTGMKVEFKGIEN